MFWDRKMTKDKRKEKGDKTKRKIIEAYYQILAAEGKKGLTTRKIAEKAGVGKGSIYHHFESIDEILIEATKLSTDVALALFTNKEFKNLKDFIKYFGYITIESVIAHLKMGTGYFSVWEEMFQNENVPQGTICCFHLPIRRCPV